MFAPMLVVTYKNELRATSSRQENETEYDYQRDRTAGRRDCDHDTINPHYYTSIAAYNPETNQNIRNKPAMNTAQRCTLVRIKER